MAAPKAVRHAQITRLCADGSTDPVYELMDRLIANHFPETVELSIGLVFVNGINPDRDGKITLGKCCKTSERDRAFHNYDVIIELNSDFWHDPATTNMHREYLVFHELCHIGISKDENDEAKRDERNRLCVYIKKHEVEEFVPVIEKYGLLMPQVQRMARAIFAAQRGEQPQDDAPEVQQELITAEEAVESQ